MVFTHSLKNTKHLCTDVSCISFQMEECKIQVFKHLETTQSGKYFDLSGMEELCIMSSFMIYAADLVSG